MTETGHPDGLSLAATPCWLPPEAKTQMVIVSLNNVYRRTVHTLMREEWLWMMNHIVRAVCQGQISTWNSSSFRLSQFGGHVHNLQSFILLCVALISVKVTVVPNLFALRFTMHKMVHKHSVDVAVTIFVFHIEIDTNTAKLFYYWFAWIKVC